MQLSCCNYIVCLTISFQRHPILTACALKSLQIIDYISVYLYRTDRQDRQRDRMQRQMLHIVLMYSIQYVLRVAESSIFCVLIFYDYVFLLMLVSLFNILYPSYVCNMSILSLNLKVYGL